MQYERETLPNGLRVVVASMPQARSVSMSIYVGVGSRYETGKTSGIAHLLEHMVFKGTAKRPTADAVSFALERIGGFSNAVADREATIFTARTTTRHFLGALDILADMICAPLLRESDLDAERSVVIEELRMYRDQPQDRAKMLLNGLLYPDHPLGWEVVGKERVIRALVANDLRRFVETWYAPRRIVVAVAGNVSPADVLDAVAEQFGALTEASAIDPQDVRPIPPPSPATQHVSTVAKTGQAHLCVGWRTVPYGPEKFVFDVLNSVLGYSMSSRLVLELRTRKGLAYEVETMGVHFDDTGHFSVYAGVDPARLVEAVDVTLAEVARLVDDLVDGSELEHVRELMKCRIELHMEDTLNVSTWIGLQEMFEHGRLRTVEESCRIVDEISAADVRDVASRYLRRDQAYVAAIGPRRLVHELSARFI